MDGDVVAKGRERVAGEVGKDNDIEAESLGFVNRHDVDDAFGFGFADRVALGEAEKFVHVAAAAAIELARRNEKFVSASAREGVEGGAALAEAIDPELEEGFETFSLQFAEDFRGEAFLVEPPGGEEALEGSHAQVPPGEGVTGMSRETEEGEEGLVESAVGGDRDLGFAQDGEIGMGADVIDGRGDLAVGLEENGTGEAALDG